jgi:methyl-accepting chemotaxis protein-2 (aspartate sensor receptor)
MQRHASLHQQTQQLKEAVSVIEISETVLRTQQMDDTRGQAAAFALSGMRAI